MWNSRPIHQHTAVSRLAAVCLTFTSTRRGRVLRQPLVYPLLIFQNNNSKWTVLEMGHVQRQTTSLDFLKSERAPNGDTQWGGPGTIYQYYMRYTNRQLHCPNHSVNAHPRSLDLLLMQEGLLLLLFRSFPASIRGGGRKVSPAHWATLLREQLPPPGPSLTAGGSYNLQYLAVVCLPFTNILVGYWGSCWYPAERLFSNWILTHSLQAPCTLIYPPPTPGLAPPPAASLKPSTDYSDD